MLPDLNQLWQLVVALILLLSGGQVGVPEWLPDDLSELENLPWQELLPAAWPPMPFDLLQMQPATLPPVSEPAVSTSRATRSRPAAVSLSRAAAEVPESLPSSGTLSLPALEGGAAAWMVDPGQAESRIVRRSRVVRTGSPTVGEEQPLKATRAAPTLAGLGLVAIGALGGLAMIATRRRR
jgi:hypothetical protein